MPRKRQPKVFNEKLRKLPQNGMSNMEETWLLKKRETSMFSLTNYLDFCSANPFSLGKQSLKIQI